MAKPWGFRLGWNSRCAAEELEDRRSMHGGEERLQLQGQSQIAGHSNASGHEDRRAIQSSAQHAEAILAGH
jgi:hypothetical protein